MRAHMNMASGYQANIVVSVLSQIGLPRLPDTWMMLHEQYEDMLPFFDCGHRMLKSVAIQWVKCFPSFKLQNSYTIRGCHHSLHPQIFEH